MALCAPYVDGSEGRIDVTTEGDLPTGDDLYDGKMAWTSDGHRLYVYDETGLSWFVQIEPMQSYTPTFTNCSGGAATGGYHRSDGWCEFWARYVFAGAGVAGAVTVSLPKTLALASVFDVDVRFADANVGWFPGLPLPSSTTTIGASASIASTTTTTYGSLSATVPFTWANLDEIIVTGRFRMDTRYS